MSICVFDTETTGLPICPAWLQYYTPYDSAKYDGARLVELAYLIMDGSGNVLHTRQMIVTPDGFQIENAHIHGITNEQATREGMPIADVLRTFYRDLCQYKCHKIVAHNLGFDYNVLLAESARSGRHRVLHVRFKNMRKACTMMMGQRALQTQRVPSLRVLYETLFQMQWSQEHRAMADVEKCADCYRRLRFGGAIQSTTGVAA